LLAFCGIVAAQLTAEVEVALPIGRRPPGESWVGLVDGRAFLLSETKGAKEKHESASPARGSENLFVIRHRFQPLSALKVFLR
jgi:hypothetical protein